MVVTGRALVTRGSILVLVDKEKCTGTAYPGLLRCLVHVH